jgi:hypothetical protein
MKKIIIGLFLLLCVSATNLQAQDYNTGVGLRGGPFNGFTIKHFLTATTAVEGVLSTQWSGWLISATWEKHAQAFDVEGLNWFYGVGGQIGFWNQNNYPGYDPKHGNYTVIGVHGALGLEYTFKEIPFSIGADWKPAINLVGYGNRQFWGGDMSGAYIRFNF